MNLFQSAIRKKNLDRPPVWMMRQAGRYHSHYQQLRKQYSFLDLCKKPEVACETTLGPIQDFNFDAAILFSDLLFPLEVMGMGLKYEEGPQLDWHLKSYSDLAKLKTGRALAEGLKFQSEALTLIRKSLSPEKGLLGFVGGPVTLFCYAVDGSHKGDLSSSRSGIEDGRYQGFFEKLEDILVENMVQQARGGADAIAVLDTCAGEFGADVYQKKLTPSLKQLFEKFKKFCPETPVIYYSKKTNPEYWESFKSFLIDGIGIDWNHSIAEVLRDWSKFWAIQGNVDPNWLFLDSDELEKRLRAIFLEVKGLPIENRKGWICGLGHGILPKTPESNVRLFLKLQKEIFSNSP